MKKINVLSFVCLQCFNNFFMVNVYPLPKYQESYTFCSEACFIAFRLVYLDFVTRLRITKVVCLIKVAKNKYSLKSLK